MSYEQIAQLLEGISERFNWKRLIENGYIIGLKQVSGVDYLFAKVYIYYLFCDAF